VHKSQNAVRVLPYQSSEGRLVQRSPTGGPRITDVPREKFGGPWRNLDIICNFYVYYTVSLYSDSSSCHRHRIADNFRLITLNQISY
jgi:hypothetical protein